MPSISFNGLGKGLNLEYISSTYKKHICEMEGIQKVIMQRKDEEHTVAIEILLKSDLLKERAFFSILHSLLQ